MSHSADIVSFLRTDPQIAKLNFAAGKLRLWPAAFLGVADLIDDGSINVGAKASAGNAAEYDMNLNRLDVRPGFSIGNPQDRAAVVHECAHALVDAQGIGSHSGHEDEGAAYIAEALYLEASGEGPIGTQPCRAIAHAIAGGLLAGGYAVPGSSFTQLCTAVGAEPTYAAKPTYVSSGMGLSVLLKIVRRL